VSRPLVCEVYLNPHGSGDQPLDPTGVTILLVEQDSHVRQVAQRGLSRRGYQVLTAADRGQALKILATHHAPIHVLVSTIGFPRVNRSTVYVYTSARMGDAERLAHSGPRTAFLAKPWSITEVETTIRQLLGQHSDTTDDGPRSGPLSDPKALSRSRRKNGS
jgi:DNA-binding response OmpR family regulator